MRARLALFTLVALLTAPAADAAGEYQIDRSYRPTTARTYVAKLREPVAVYRYPGERGLRYTQQAWIPRTGNPVVLQVLERRVGPDGRSWLKVLLPRRPNGSTGWIRQGGVRIDVEPARVVISLSKHRLTVLRRGRIKLRLGVALGAESTPTPKGRFAIYQKVREPEWSPLGPWALHLTAHSNVLFEYDGGPGRVAIHGARGALFAVAGENVSHGCIRVPNPGIVDVAALVRPGTPVLIVA